MTEYNFDLVRKFKKKIVLLKTISKYRYAVAKCCQVEVVKTSLLIYVSHIKIPFYLDIYVASLVCYR